MVPPRWGWVLGLIAAAACGRVRFEALGDGVPVIDGGGTDAAPDAVGVPSGLVAWFPLDDPPGTSFIDLVAGRGGTCTTTRCPTPVPGHLGTARQFDGTDDCITVPDSGHLQPAQITIALWANQAMGGSRSHVSKRVLTGPVNSWQVEADVQGMNPMALGFTTYDGMFNRFISAAPDSLVLSIWQHLAVTYDGVDKRVYVAGNLVASMPFAGPLSYDQNPMKIGCDDNGGTEALHYAGVLDDIQVYDRALGLSEIRALAAR